MLGAGAAAADSLVSNLGETTDTFTASLTNRDVAQSFRTGSDANAYEITGVTVEFAPAPSGTATVSAFIADGRDTSDNIIANLRNPSSWSTTSTFIVPDETTLAANTTYHVIIEGTDGAAATTSSNSEDSGSLSGWTIEDTRYQRTMVSDSGLGGTWVVGSLALKISVEGTIKPPPSAPRFLRAKGYSATEINLSWSAPAETGGANITGYKIEVSTDGSSNWTDLVADTSSTSTTYSHTGLTLSAKRYYRVSAITAVGTGPVSDTASAIAEPDVGRIPGNLRAKAVSMTQIDLSWSRPKTRPFLITGYKIESSRDGWAWSVLEADTSSTDYSHTGLRAGHTWFYRVSAINARGPGPASTLAVATTTAPPPSVGETVVPSTWSLIPPGVGPGDKFRLLFVTATTRNATSSNIADYNSFVQAAAAANADIASYSSTFRVVASTPGMDARINTASADANVPVYWMDGLRVAEGHWDFYGSTLYGVTWDNRGNGKKSDGSSFGSGRVWTGSVGTGSVREGQGLGSSRPGLGNPASRPLEINTSLHQIALFPFYGISGVFQVDGTPGTETVQPVLWVSDSTGYEFRRAMFFSVTLDPPATETVTVDYYTRAGSAKQGTDYVHTQGTLTFAPGAGAAVQGIRVEIIDDDVEDSGETFEMILISPSNATIADSQGIGKIFNSDPNAQEVSIAAGTSPVTEGTDAVFTLSRTGESTEEALTVTVDVTESGAMLEGTAPTEVTFAADAATATLTVATADDEAAEAASPLTVTVVAGDGYGVAVDGTAATVTVADDDAAPEVTATALDAPENGTAVATLTATDADTAATDLQWSIAGGVDAAAFTLSAGGVLAFEAAKDYEAPDDADTDGDYAVTVQVTDGANPVEAALTVSLTDVAERAPAGTVWSAKMTVVAYGTGAVGAATADLFASQVGSGNLRAKWLWYQPSERKLRLAFDAGVADAEELRLHLGEMSLSFPENSGGNSSFSWEDVDIAWTDGQTVAVRVAEPSDEADGADETVTDGHRGAGRGDRLADPCGRERHGGGGAGGHRRGYRRGGSDLGDGRRRG